MSSVIELRGLTKFYVTPAGRVPGLRGIDLSVDEGEFAVVVGKSGAGKSTLINLVSGILPPTSGEIWINGTAVHLLNEDERARWRGNNLGVVFQLFRLLPDLTLIENITLTMDFRNSYPLRQRRERALHLLEQMEIIEHAHKMPTQISGGQQQRVAIARALANNPPVIVADEPTGNLDSKTSEAIMTVFERLVAEGKTLLMVTHDRNMIRCASSVVELSDGVVVR